MEGASLSQGVGGLELRRRLIAGELSTGELVEELILAIGSDPLHAWAAVEPEGLRAQAEALDRMSPERREAAPLFGVPIAIKDNFDTNDHPTAYGSAIYAGQRPSVDAAAVAVLRRAGALIAGKTTCTEFACLGPTQTLNPLAPARTPGGSSSGSASVVSAGIVPLATGTQTAGSINRPASYCGVLGYKPSFGLIDRAGVKLVSGTLDTVGLLGRELEDLRAAAVALGIGALAGDAEDSGTSPRGVRLALARTELWPEVEVAAAAAIDEWVESHRQAGNAIQELKLPGYARLVDAQMTVQVYETARALTPEREQHPDLISESLLRSLDDGMRVTDAQHQAALASARQLGPGIVAALADFDAVLTPSALGPPPLGHETTGDPLFCRVWTLLGSPSLSVPLVWTGERLPVPLQLVAAPGADRTIFHAAETLVRPSYRM